jgi:TonB family protein
LTFAAQLENAKIAAMAPPKPRVDVKRVTQWAVLLALLVALAIWGIMLAVEPPPVQRLAKAAAPAETRPAATAPARKHASAEAPDATAAQAASAAAPARSRRAQRAPDIGGPPGPSLGATPPPAPAPASSTGSTATAQPDAPAPERRPEVSAPGRDAIYSAADADVSPPIARQSQQLGQVPLAERRENVVMIEVLVNADGTVAEARALGSPPSLDNAMVVTMALSAAKTWRFQPARKDGRPVRYRHVLPVSLR